MIPRGFFGSLKSCLGRGRSTQPLVSFIVPFYASHDRLPACLASIYQHTSLPFELLLIDDGNESFDFSQMEAMPSLHLIRMSRNEGPGASRNRGISEASGKYIQFVDSDDKLLGDAADYFAQTQIAMPAGDPDIIVGALEGAQLDRGFGLRLPSITTVSEKLTLMKLASFTAHLYRTDFLRSIGASFPTDVRKAEDTVFLTRTLPRAKQIALKSVAHYRYHSVENSLSKVEPSFEEFEVSYGRVGRYIVEALTDFPEAQSVKCSVLFKYGVRTAQRWGVFFTDDQRCAAAEILRHVATSVDLVSAAAHAARRSAPVYWDETFSACVSLLQSNDFEGFYAYLEQQEIRIFKGERRRRGRQQS